MHRNALIEYFVAFYRDEEGQSISEYAAVLAFVAILVAMAFNLATGSLFSSVTGSYSVTVQNLSNMNSYSSSSSS